MRWKAIVVKRGLLFCGILLILSGCMIFPHHTYDAPSISGILRQGNSPLTNAPVYLNTGIQNDCKKFDLIARTNEEGEFNIGPVIKLRWILVSDEGTVWELCTETSEGRKAILVYSRLFLPRTHPKLLCDISAKEAVTEDIHSISRGRCTQIPATETLLERSNISPQ